MIPEWALALIFASAISAHAINPIATAGCGCGPITNEAMYFLAIQAPAIHELVVKQVTKIEYDPSYRGWAKIWTGTGVVTIGSTRYMQHIIKNEAKMWAAILAHEARERHAYNNGYRFDHEPALQTEWAVLYTLGAPIWRRDLRLLNPTWSPTMQNISQGQTVPAIP